MDFLQGKRLYKFYGLNERNLEAIAKPYLWFSKLHDFNDPFEGKMRIITKIPSAREALAFVKMIVEKGGDKTLPNGPHSRFEGMSDAEAIAELTSVFETSHDSQKHLLYEAGYCSLIAATEIEERTRTVEQDILMWSHYANGLRGFRVEFDPAVLTATLSERHTVTPIKYGTTPPEVDLFLFNKLAFSGQDAAAGAMFLEGLFHKHIAWAYEREIRLGSDAPGKYTYSANAIKEIVIGEKVSADQANLLRRIVESHRIDIPIKKAWIARESYEVVIR